MAQKYREETEMMYEKKLQKISELLPDYCKPFITYLKLNNEIRSCFSYIEDLKLFFEYLLTQGPMYGEKISDIKLEILDQLTPDDFYEYVVYLTRYTDKNGVVRTNNDVTKKHKINSLRVFYNYYYNNKYIENNPLTAVRLKKPNIKEIVVLTPEEMHILFDYMDNLEDSLRIRTTEPYCSKSISQRYHYYCKNKIRDKAIIMVFLGTGIRVSECVGLDISDVDFRQNCLKIVRKGGNEDHVFFNDDVADILKSYIESERKIHEKDAEDKNILFYSKNNSRLGVRSIEKMIKKYVTEALPDRNDVSVHKLRSTFATHGYNATRDIYAISKALGHSSLSMASRYAKADDKDKKRVSESIHFIKQGKKS